MSIPKQDEKDESFKTCLVHINHKHSIIYLSDKKKTIEKKNKKKTTGLCLIALWFEMIRNSTIYFPFFIIYAN